MERRIKKIRIDIKGITLVALVVTIIVLLILAGVAISFTIGDNGIFRKAQDASKIYENAQKNETISLEEISNYIDDVNKGNINNGEDEEEINKNEPNAPILKTGMTAIKFNEPTETSNGTVIETNTNESQWYNYENKKLITELLIYSIIGLLAIASYFCIFNILFSNIQSRKKDFANLKSIGMSQKQIHKILWIESTWYCAVSSIIGILAGIGVFLLIYYIENKVRGGYGLYQYEIVWQNILICIAFAIFSVYSSMLIARKSIKKNNIIESIKEENI